MTPQPISAIIATVGRPELLRLCLDSLRKQTVPVAEVVVVHCGDDEATPALTKEACWNDAGMTVRYFHYPERNCAAQRNFALDAAVAAAIAEATATTTPPTMATTTTASR